MAQKKDIAAEKARKQKIVLAVVGVALVGLAAILAGWMRHEKAQEAVVDRRLDAERAAIRARETRLAERLAGERDSR